MIRCLIFLWLTSSVFANNPPIPGPDSYAGTWDTPIQIEAPGLLANDSDPDGDTLETHLETAPERGYLSLFRDGGFRYEPEFGFAGTVTFVYKAWDGVVAATSIVTLNITPGNKAPIAVADRFELEPDTRFTLPAPGVMANDYDPEGGTLTAHLLTPPDIGHLGLSQDGSFWYDPEPGFAGEVSFIYKVSDGSAVSPPATVTLLIGSISANGPPVIVSTPPEQAAPGRTYRYQAEAVDPDGDPLTWSLDQGPAGMAIDADGQVTWTPSLPTGKRPMPRRKDLLILGSTVKPTGPEYQAAFDLGLSYDVVTPEEWRAMTTDDFAAYGALILGDPDRRNTTEPIRAAEETVSIWGPAVTGNVLIHGSDPSSHGDLGTLFTRNAFRFVSDGSRGTGAYIAFSEYYWDAPAFTAVAVLDAFGPGAFTVNGAACFDDVHIAAGHPVLDNLTDETLSDWGCTVHQGFDSFPADWHVLAVARELNLVYTAPSGIQGAPFILARSPELRVVSDLSVFPVRSDALTGTEVTIHAGVVGGDAAPLTGSTVQLTVIEGPNQGLTLASSSDAGGLARFTLNSAVAGEDIFQCFFIDPAGQRQRGDRGRIRWHEGSLENASISVTDQISGSDVQAWTIRVLPAGTGVPNRFLSTPDFAARAGIPWTYRAQAVNGAGEPGRVHLIRGPEGLGLRPAKRRADLDAGP